MGTTGMVALGLAGMLVAPPPEPSPEYSPGIGYTVAWLQRQADVVEPVATAEPPRFELYPHLPPPPSDLSRVQSSPRGQAVLAAAAVATQVAMIVAGIIAVRQQRDEARRERARQPEPFRPYR